MMMTARNITEKRGDELSRAFGSKIKAFTDSLILDSGKNITLAVTGLPFYGPLAKSMANLPELYPWLQELKNSVEQNTSILIIWDEESSKIEAYRDKCDKPGICQIEIQKKEKEILVILFQDFTQWPGEINDAGEHRINLKSPAPGPHFFVNMLLGNRVGYPHPLQTTPKSVIDRYGRGSFRSHADTQVLATRWDMLQEENGHPCNRQFYLYEGSTRIFYSADIQDENILSAECIHSQNSTIISYTTRCGLKIERRIFLPGQKPSLPLACEIQEIKITSITKNARRLRIVYTGMFGSAKPAALQEDVLYSTIIMQAGALINDDNTIAAISPDYYPEDNRYDLRFHSMKIFKGDKSGTYPGEFCTSYQEFKGEGSLENPEGALNLTNKLNLKGPGFFALAEELDLEPEEPVYVENFTGLVSSKTNKDFSEESLAKEVSALHKYFSSPDSIQTAFRDAKAFYEKYASFLKVKTSDPLFSTYVSRNLPFQVLYQTFVSRSFGQTQKGYREIGFREIQDLFASMYFFHAMGETPFIKDLLEEWISKVFTLGYTYHNFFWEGKEAGKWSDDGLWLLQAVSRYVKLTGDKKFLTEKFPTADGSERTLLETLEAIIKYSGEISIGRHGLPLLDRADWNDCLRLRRDFDDGPTKQEKYQSGNSAFIPGENDAMESVMNAFLLKIAADEFTELAEMSGESGKAKWAGTLSGNLTKAVQTHAWKKHFFSRLLINSGGEYSFAGSPGDGLSTDPEIDGTYFLNSFSWSILSEAADEKQITSMLSVVNRHLKTPYGYKLVTPMDLSRVNREAATSEYFPGDRENGAVFKHASMMAVSAMLKAAKNVNDSSLAAELAESAWWMIDIVKPCRTMENPFEIAGNPRFCTQYNNTVTGENIGPLLSGTSTWLILALMDAFGISYQTDRIILDPILKKQDRKVELEINESGTTYSMVMIKDEGFKRLKDCTTSDWTLTIDGKLSEKCEIPLFRDKKNHTVEFRFL